MSRATELHFRHPREIGDAIYKPTVSTASLPLTDCFYPRSLTQENLSTLGQLT